MILTRPELKQITGCDYYDGDMIHSRFAYKVFRDNVNAVGDIVAFRAPMTVEAEGMIDQEDLLKNDYIYSEDAMNFCWEIPNMCPLGAVAFQRLFNTQIAHILSNHGVKPIEMDGDDLMVHKEFTNRGILQSKGKCSVSITVCRDGVAMGHTAINLKAGDRAPAFAFSTNLEDVSHSVMEAVCVTFRRIIDDMFVATTKVI